MNQFATIDAYINSYPAKVQNILQSIREQIKQAAPKAQETIAYGIPTFTLNGNLVHFGAFKHHIGFYPTPSGVEEFKEELSRYKGAKGSVQFPLNQPMPLNLIRRIVLFRVNKTSSKNYKTEGKIKSR